MLLPWIEASVLDYILIHLLLFVTIIHNAASPNGEIR